MRRRDPAVGANALALENFESVDELPALLLEGNAREFTVAIEADDAGVTVDVAVLISVQPDGPSACLPAPYDIPEVFVPFAFVQVGVYVVGHDSQDRADIFVDHDLLELLPERPVDRRAHIIEAH